MPAQVRGSQPAQGIVSKLVNGNFSRGVEGWRTIPRDAVPPVSSLIGPVHLAAGKTVGGFASATPFNPIYIAEVPGGFDIVNEFHADDLVSTDVPFTSVSYNLLPLSYTTYRQLISPLAIVDAFVPGSSHAVLVEPTRIRIRLDRVALPDGVATPLSAVPVVSGWFEIGTEGVARNISHGALDTRFNVSGTATLSQVDTINPNEIFLDVPVTYSAGPGETTAVAGLVRAIRPVQGDVVEFSSMLGRMDALLRIGSPFTNPGTSSYRSVKPLNGDIVHYASSDMTPGVVTFEKVAVNRWQFTLPVRIDLIVNDRYNTPLPGTDLNPLRPSDFFVTPTFGGQVVGIVSTTSTTTTIEVVDNGVFLISGGRLNTQPEEGTLTDWRLCPFIRGFAVWKPAVPCYEATLTHWIDPSTVVDAELNDAPGSVDRSLLRVLDDFGRVTGVIAPVSVGTIETVGTTPTPVYRRRALYRSFAGDVYKGRRVQLVLFNSGSPTPTTYKIGDVSLVRGDLTEEIPTDDSNTDQVRDAMLKSVDDVSSAIQPGSMIMFAGGTTCPPGWRPVFTGSSGTSSAIGTLEGKGLTYLGRHDPPGDPLITSVTIEQVDPSMPETMRTVIVVNRDLTDGRPKLPYASDRSAAVGVPPVRVRYDIPSLRAGMVLVIMEHVPPTKYGKRRLPCIAMPIVDVFGRDPLRDTVVVVPGWQENVIHQASAAGHVFAVVESSYLQYDTSNVGERRLGSGEHTHAMLSIGEELLYLADRYSGSLGIFTEVPTQHAHGRLGEPAAPLPRGRAFILCEKL